MVAVGGEQMTLVPERRITLGGVPVDVRSFDEAVEIIASRALAGLATPLAVASINLDHIHHFGTGSTWGTRLSAKLDRNRTSRPSVEWLNLVDGAPVAARARRVVGRAVQRLAGSDLIGSLLDRAELTGASVGFLGGSPETQSRLREDLTRERQVLRISGFWAPTREELSDPDACTRLSDEIAATKTNILIVGLGKPRQELWIAEYGPATEAQVLLAFGAVVDFLAGRVRRAPRWVARAGLEWAWRLVLEPRRLSRRYLVEGPAAMVTLLRRSSTAPGKAAAGRHRRSSNTFPPEG
jgi:exopolysaccharide biosynthesis WecB/TagA/CpsF family protein